MFNASFNWWDIQGIFRENPVRKVRMFRPKNKIVRYLSAGEYQRLLDATENIRWYLRPVIELAANTGLRRSNILALRWDECDRKTGSSGKRRPRTTKPSRFR